MATFVELLEDYLSRPEVVERMKPAHDACNKIFKAYSDLCVQTGARIQILAERAAVMPPSNGYYPWLVDHGFNSMPARMLTETISRRGRRIAAEAKRITKVENAIRFLSKPSRNKPAIARRAADLLSAWEETSIIETIFHDAHLSESEFIQYLKSIADDNYNGYRRLTELSAMIVPYLLNRRGPKISAESAAHEFFLETVVLADERHAYSWKDSEDRFTDPVTEATRREFNLRYFDPRPAYRRWKARQSANQTPVSVGR